MPDPWLPPFVHPPASADPLPARPPRSRSIRWAWAVTSVVIAATLMWCRPWESVPVVPSPLPQFEFGGLPGTLLVIGGLAVALPRVSHRRRDALIALIPFGQLWVVGMTAWRLSSLPYRDWRPRDDERARVRVVPGTRYYVLAPKE